MTMITVEGPTDQGPTSTDAEGKRGHGDRPVGLRARLRAALRGLIDGWAGRGEAGDGRRDAHASSDDAHYRRLFDGVPIALYRSAPDGTILDVNPAMVQLLGYPDRESLLRRNAFDTFVNRQDRRSQMEAVERQMVVRDYELQLRRGDGEVIWVVDQVRAVRGADGEVLYYQGSLTEITQRKRTEAELRESNEKLRAVIQSSPLAIMAMDREGRVLSWNSAAERIFGWKEHEVVGRPLVVVQPEAEAEFIELRDRVLAGEELQEMEMERCRRDGSTIHISVSAGPIYDASGVIVGIMSVANDISERKEIAEHRRQLAEILEGTPDLVGIFTVDGKGIYLNPAGRRMLEVPPSEDISQLLIWEHQSEPSRKLIREVALPQVMRNGIWSGEVVLTSRNGAEIPTSAVIIAHTTDSGEVAYLSAIVRNLTERKALEKRLREAQTMEAIGRLAGGIAHDFNNLLTSIIGHSDLLLRTLADEGQRNDVREIKTAGQRAASLTSQLLAFSRRRLAQPRLLDLNSTIADLGSRLARLTGQRIELVTVLDATLGPVKADPMQIEEVIVSLVENACEAMPDGGRLTLETGMVDLPGEIAYEFGVPEPGRYAALVVADTGCGMDEETRGRIFEPFFSTKEEVKGTGLGLATVYGIVKQGGGDVRVDSRPGSGTTVRVYLPIAQPDIRAPTAAFPHTLARESGQGTVLIAEDEPAVLSLASRVLRSAGYTVIEARDGVEALEAQSHDAPIDLLLTDVVMPRLSGPELASRLLETQPGTPVLYMSGYTDSRTVRELASDDATHFLQKPFTPTALVETIEGILAAEGRGAAH